MRGGCERRTFGAPRRAGLTIPFPVSFPWVFPPLKRACAGLALVHAGDTLFKVPMDAAITLSQAISKFSSIFPEVSAPLLPSPTRSALPRLPPSRS